jgi:thiamine biosynthesis lipoprotein
MPRAQLRLLLGMLVGLCGLGAACTAAELERFESTQPHMGVPFKIIIYAPDEATATEATTAAFARIASLDGILSDYNPDSELMRLVRAGHGTSVRISEDLWRVLSESQQLARRSGGAFDVTVGPYVRQWRRARRQKQMPAPERLAEAREAVGHQWLELDEPMKSARLLRPNMRLDLGGIGMGYAVDEALAVLRKHGIRHALVDASGDIGAADAPPGTRGWKIGVVPLSEDGTPSREILLANSAVTTAGDAFQHVVIDGKRYSHIVDPRTGFGLTDQIGVTVVARDGMTADSLDTAVSVLGPQAGLALIEATPGAAAFIVRPVAGGVETFESKGFAALVSEAATNAK